MALRVVVNLAKQNKKETFELLKKWTTSKNKWIKRLAMATIAPYIRAKPNEAKLCLEKFRKRIQKLPMNFCKDTQALKIAKFNSQKMQLFYALYRRPLGERHDQGCKRKATSGTG